MFNFSNNDSMVPPVPMRWGPLLKQLDFYQGVFYHLQERHGKSEMVELKDYNSVGYTNEGGT